MFVIKNKNQHGFGHFLVLLTVLALTVCTGYVMVNVSAVSQNEKYVLDVNSAKGCWLAGRVWDKSKNTCSVLCRSAGKILYLKPGKSIGDYCTGHISLLSQNDCIGLYKRYYVTGIGCARNELSSNQNNSKYCQPDYPHYSYKNYMGRCTLKRDAGPEPVSNSFTVSNDYCSIIYAQAPEMADRAEQMAEDCQYARIDIVRILSISSQLPRYNVVYDQNNYGMAAYAMDGIIHVSVDWLRNSSYDRGVIPHEMTHIAQAYPTGNQLWLIEGIATYMSYKLKYSSGAAHCSSAENYSAGYGCTAAFLRYIERVYAPNVISEVNRNLVKGAGTKYDSQTGFTSLTGKQTNTLYTECLQYECHGGRQVNNVNTTNRVVQNR